MTSERGCTPLISLDRDGRYQAWCKACSWFDGPVRDSPQLSRRDIDEHLGRTAADPFPSWQRGPGR